MHRVLFFVLVVSFLGAGCNTNKDKSFEGDPASLYPDYQVTGKEGDDNVTILLQYRLGNKNGNGVNLGPGAKVSLDGELIEVDSTKKNGYFYELNKSADAFVGHHVISFSIGDKEAYKEEFDFKPLTLLHEFPAEIYRLNDTSKSLTLEIADYKPQYPVTLLLTDTSVNNGFNRLDTVHNGILLLRYADLKQLTTGPVLMELVREEERILKSSPRSGRLLITFSLKREFILTDQVKP